MISEREEKWEPVEGIVTPAARAVIDESHRGLVVTMVFSEIVDGLKLDLRINFGRIRAYSVYEEFIHPWSQSREEFPRLTGEWERYTFPLVLVQNSEWVSWLSDLIIPPTPIHYRFVTLDQIVDVLCNKAPAVTWVEGLQS